MFSPEFTGQRAQILSHDHTHHLECSDCQYQTFVACVPLSPKHFKLSSMFTKLYIQSPVHVLQVGVKKCVGGAKGHIIGFGADPKGTLGAPKGTVPFGKGLARTLVFT